MLVGCSSIYLLSCSTRDAISLLRCADESSQHLGEVSEARLSLRLKMLCNLKLDHTTQTMVEYASTRHRELQDPSSISCHGFGLHCSSEMRSLSVALACSMEASR